MERDQRPKILVSMTTIPHRMPAAVHRSLDSAVSLGLDVVLSVPRSYRKWGEVEVPDSLISRGDIVLHRPEEDFGPATKLLGALDWLDEPGGYTHILTLDDDMRYREPFLPVGVLLSAAMAQKQPTVITFGGIRLEFPPYHHDAGLAYHNVGFVDAVAGFRGVLYPLDAIWPNREVFFELRHRLPPGIFHDDDCYFGIVLSSLGIPIWAVPSDIPQIGLSQRSMVWDADAGVSGVASNTTMPRKQNESELFSFAVEHGLLPNPFSPRLTALGRAMRSRPPRVMLRLARRLWLQLPAGFRQVVRRLLGRV